MDLVDQKVGKSGDLDLKVVDGKLELSFAFKEGPLDAGLSAKVEVDYFLDKLAALIPGKVDDAVISLIKSALKGL